MKCDKCENEAVYIGKADPYDEEINGDATPVNLCEKCRQSSLDDI